MTSESGKPNLSTTMRMKKGVAEKLAERLLDSLSDGPHCFSLDYDYKGVVRTHWDLQIRFHGNPTGGVVKPAELITRDGQGYIYAFFGIDCWVREFSFDFDINRAYRPGRLRWVCFRKVKGICIAGMWVTMPRIPPRSIGFNFGEILSGEPLPLFAIDAGVAIERVDSDVDGEKLQLKALVGVDQLWRPRLNGPRLALMVDEVTAKMRARVGDAVAGEGSLRNVLRYVSDFIENLARYALDRMAVVQALRSYVYDRLGDEFHGYVLKRFCDTSHHFKLAKIGRVHELVKEAPPQGPIDLKLADFTIDVATDCGEPELRAKVTVEG